MQCNANIYANIAFPDVLLSASVDSTLIHLLHKTCASSRECICGGGYPNVDNPDSIRHSIRHCSYEPGADVQSQDTTLIGLRLFAFLFDHCFCQYIHDAQTVVINVLGTLPV